MKINVDLGPQSYPILIEPGLLQTDIAAQIRKQTKSEKIFVITDENVANHHMNLLEDLDTLVLPAGESSKSFDMYSALCEELLAIGIDRQTTLVAFGGGVIGDLVGFAASTLLRGLPFVQIPTSLLAQVDSAVGGKTAIDTPQGKNLVGTFYQPKAVFIDPEILSTLPDRHLKAGYAEIVKYALINDAKFFTKLEKDAEKVLNRDSKILTETIATCCKAKAAIVKEDEKEHGKRALLNLGHTFGHALEKLNNYEETLLHGEAVAAGIMMAFELSYKMDLCTAEDVLTIRSHLKQASLPTSLKNFRDIKNLQQQPEAILEAMKSDKKAEGDTLVFILSRGIGQAFISKDVPEALVLETLAESAT